MSMYALENAMRKKSIDIIPCWLSATATMLFQPWIENNPLVYSGNLKKNLRPWPMMNSEKNLESANTPHDNAQSHLSTDNQLAQYSDVEKAEAVRKLDWNLILLWVLSCFIFL